MLAIRQDIDPFAKAIDSDGVDGRPFRSLFDQHGVAGFDIPNHVGELARLEDDAVSDEQLTVEMPMLLRDGSAEPSWIEVRLPAHRQVLDFWKICRSF
ncbi:hypothetical protein [Mesorhizobium sp. L48C026A00]|uniref:hypothetical protein n=1 Tax=Mesorhizobium sp. L48C026A00 TaxID=1287182 RepID=UPI0012EC5056|nr:hypothetical protein [Mesorhizobium sp. L48C026A00]